MSQAARDRLFRGYGPLIGLTAMFLAIAVLVPSQTASGRRWGRRQRIISDRSEQRTGSGPDRR